MGGYERNGDAHVKENNVDRPEEMNSLKTLVTQRRKKKIEKRESHRKEKDVSDGEKVTHVYSQPSGDRELR